MSARNPKQYGRIAVGQLVRYSAAKLAPTNSPEPGSRVRDRATGKSTRLDNLISFDAVGMVTDLDPVTSGCWATVTLPEGGQLRAHIDWCGRDNGNFRGLRVLREAPTQMEMTA
jgi:hypothetical protein